MQHRRKNQRPARSLQFILGGVLLVAGGFIFLVMKDMPAPQAQVEKPLDTAQFIKDKQ